MNASDASSIFLDHLNAQIEAGSHDEPISPAQAVEMLRWLTASHYHAAMQLTRLRKAGFEIEREDGKSVDSWVGEEVQAANRMQFARQALERRSGFVD